MERNEHCGLPVVCAHDHRHLHLSWAWVLFENVRGVLRATVAASAWTGAKVKWVVTRRVGAARSPGKHKSKLVQDTLNPARYELMN